MTDYERAYEFGQTVGRFAGVLVLFIIAVLVYAAYRVRRQKSLIREEKVDPPWEPLPEGAMAQQDAPSDLDDWDRRYLADEITEEEWEANRRADG